MNNQATLLVTTLLSLAAMARAHPEPPPERRPPGGDPHSASREAALRNETSITIDGDFRMIRANGVPDHPTGPFPNRNNPNRIAPQNYAFRVPLKPAMAAQPTPARLQPFGVAVNGVVFDPGAAEWWRGDRNWQYEPMHLEGRLGADDSNAHVQPTGAYHYHAMPTALLARLMGSESKMALIGWAADGFPIYGPWGYSDARDAQSPLKKLQSSYRIKSGTRPGGPGGRHDGTFVADYEFVKGAGDLDECNGRFGVTPEFPQGAYYYVLTENWPFIPRLYRGTPDESFTRRGGSGGAGLGPARASPPGRGTGPQRPPSR